MKNAIIKGSECEVIAVKGGWTTYYDMNGSIRKCRNSEVKAVKTSGATQDTPSVATGGTSVATKKTTTGSSSDSPKSKEPRSFGAGLGKIKDTKFKKDRFIMFPSVFTAGGYKAVDVGDHVATTLRGLDLETAYKEYEAITGGNAKMLEASLAHLNPGMQRMNIGNRIRAHIRKASEKK